MSMTSKPLKAVVLGGTGAVGAQILGQLLVNPAWNEVVVVGRREAPVPEGYSGYDPAKLVQRVVDMDQLATQAADAFQGASSVFCALGTTRGVAGSAEAFLKVDLEYVKEAAQAAKAAGVPHFSLISAQGANPKSWGSTLKIMHAFLYMRAKGLAEEAVKAQGFGYTTILRPGLLDRGNKARGTEKIFGYVMGATPASQVAAAAVGDATAFHTGKDGPKSGVTVIDTKGIHKW